MRDSRYTFLVQPEALTVLIGVGVIGFAIIPNMLLFYVLALALIVEALWLFLRLFSTTEATK